MATRTDRPRHARRRLRRAGFGAVTAGLGVLVGAVVALGAAPAFAGPTGQSAAFSITAAGSSVSSVSLTPSVTPLTFSEAVNLPGIASATTPPTAVTMSNVVATLDVTCTDTAVTPNTSSTTTITEDLPSFTADYPSPYPTTGVPSGSMVDYTQVTTPAVCPAGTTSMTTGSATMSGSFSTSNGSVTSAVIYFQWYPDAYGTVDCLCSGGGSNQTQLTFTPVTTTTTVPVTTTTVPVTTTTVPVTTTTVPKPVTAVATSTTTLPPATTVPPTTTIPRKPVTKVAVLKKKPAPKVTSVITGGSSSKKPPSPTLAFTGGNWAWFLGIGLALVAGGVAMVAVSKTGRPSTSGGQ